MPPALVKAHAELDRAVDLCYRPQPFTSERQRMEYLFAPLSACGAPWYHYGTTTVPQTDPAAGSKRPRNHVSD
jgi:hypothetical protein